MGQTLRFPVIRGILFILTLHLCFAQHTKLHGQSLQVLSYDSLVVGDAENSSAIYAYAAIQNTSAFDVDVMVKRLDIDYTALTDSNAICWGICHLPAESVSRMAITIEAGGIDSLNFTGHVYPDKDGVPAEGAITYIFYDENNPQDSTAITVQYEVDVVSSISTQSSPKVSVYPNPMTTSSTVSLGSFSQSPGSVSLFDLSGRQVSEWPFSKNQNQLVIDLGFEDPGIYLYTIQNEKGQTYTGKLIKK